MKALKFSLIAVFVFVAFASCEEYYTTEEYYNYEVWTEDVEVTYRNWSLIGKDDEIGTYFQCIIDNVPLKDAYYDGIITVDMYKNYNNKSSEVLTPLPYTKHMVEIDQYNNEIPYTIHYTYEAKPDNKIYIKAIVSDYWTSNFFPDDAWFKIALMW